MVATLDYHLKEAPPELFDGIRWTLLTFFILHANERNRCWPSMRGLAVKLGRSLPYLTEAKQWLIEHGAIRLVPYKERVGEKEKTVSKRQHMYELSGTVKFGDKVFPYLHLPDKHGDDACETSMDQPGLTSTPLNINPVDDQRGSPLSISSKDNSTEPKESESFTNVQDSAPAVAAANNLPLSVQAFGSEPSEVQSANGTVPPGFAWIASSSSTSFFAHLTTGSLTGPVLCKRRLTARNWYTPGQPYNKRDLCPDCLRIAAERAQRKASKPKQPPQYGDVFKALVECYWQIPLDKVPEVTRKRAGKVAKALLRNYPDATADEVCQSAKDYRAKGSADLPLGETTMPDYFARWRTNGASNGHSRNVLDRTIDDDWRATNKRWGY
jgi:hypothetical protein